MRRWMIVLLVVVLLGGAWAWRARDIVRDSTSSEGAVRVDGTPVAADAKTEAGSHRGDTPRVPLVPTGVASQPLPADGAPIAEVYDALAARARAGDNAAAMHLVRALQRCYRMDFAQVALDFQIDQAAEQGASRHNETMVHIDAQVRADRAFCAGLDTQRIDARGEWVVLAATRGDTVAMTCYGAHPDDYAPPFLTDAWFEWSRRWRERAPAMVEEAYARGQLEVLTILTASYSGEHHEGIPEAMTPLQGIVAADPARAAAYAGIAWRTGRVGAHYAERMWGGLDDAGRRRAEAIIARDAPRFVAQKGVPKTRDVCFRLVRGLS